MQRLIYVSEFSQNAVDIFSLGGSGQQMIGQIAPVNGPQGLAVDEKSHVYVVSWRDSKILEYSAGRSPKHLFTLDDSGHLPSGVAIDAVSGDVAVANYIKDGSTNGDLTFFHAGESTPYKSLSNPNFVRMYHDAFDADGNLYVVGVDGSSVAQIGKVSAGAASIVILPISVGSPGGIHVDDRNDLLLEDNDGHSIDCYALDGSYLSCGTIALRNARFAIDFARTSNNRFLYTAEYRGNDAKEYSFPSGGRPVNTIRLPAHPYGIAIAPAQR